MDYENRGALQLVALAGAVVVLLGVAALAGLAINDSTPTGAEVLSDVEDRYQSADSVLVDANVTAERNDSVMRFSLHTVTTKDGQVRTNVSNGSEYLLLGQTENTTWLTDSKSGATVVVSSDEFADRPSMTGFGGTPIPGFSAAHLGPANESFTVFVYGLENATLDPVDGWTGNRSFGDMNTSMDSIEWNEGKSDKMDLNWSVDAFQAHNSTGDWSKAHDLNHSSKTQGLENNSIAEILEETNLTAELVDTTIEEDQEVHVVEVTHPERKGAFKVWATTETATVLKYQISTPNVTMTMDIAETRFNVSPAQSTFQPSITSQTDRKSADTLEELQAQAPFPVGIPSEDWDFSGGSIVASPMEAVIGQYESNGSTIGVIQSTSPRFARFSEEGRTVNVGERNVTIVEITEDRTIARWSRQDQTVMVAGDVSEPVLLEFVRSLDFSS